MSKSLIGICTGSFALKLLVLASFLVSLIQTCVEWYELNEIFKLAREQDIGIEIYATEFRTSLGFTLILFGSLLAVISPRFSKASLLLMTILLATYWILLLTNGHRLSFPNIVWKLGFIRHLTFISYEIAPLMALLIGYWAWFKKQANRLIAATGVMCVVFQFFTWFVDTRLMANMDWAGTSYQYPPITINATFFGATWGHVVLLILCIITVIAFEIAIKRNEQIKEFGHL